MLSAQVARVRARAVEFAGDLGDDGGLGGQQAGDEQGRAGSDRSHGVQYA